MTNLVSSRYAHFLPWGLLGAVLAVSGCAGDGRDLSATNNAHWAMFAVYRSYQLWSVDLPVNARDAVPGTDLVVFPEGPWSLVLSAKSGQTSGWVAKFEDLDACLRKAEADSGVTFSRHVDKQDSTKIGAFNEVGLAGHFFHFYKGDGACVFLESVNRIDPDGVRRVAEWVSAQ